MGLKKETYFEGKIWEEMKMITKDMVINDVIRKYPKTVTVFSNFKVDACCGGGFSIEKTVATSGIDMNALLAALNKVVQAGSK
ncbi:MAG: Iron-sulfur cluster repair protein ScdA [Candidatus Brocadia fulgida]|nr:Iron-sulfur cluster repair protein ScdA [Candidatus Brocadia fulgida]